MSDDGQVTSSAAEVYDEFFLPALFAQWAPRLVAAAQLAPGMRAIDVACGTGALALAASEAVGPSGSVTGVDVNPGMLAVARRKAPGVDWREAPAEQLPCADGAFDAALSQFGLMFFRDREAALAEMWRVLRPGGRLALAVWGALEDAPGYAAVVALLARLFGQEAANALRAPYCMGDSHALEKLLASAGIEGASVERVAGQAHFASIRAWMHTDVRGWTLADAIEDTAFERLVAEAERELAGFVAPDGAVRFAHPALVATARKA